jgi:type IV secretory pathway VirD2 relaxase
MPKRLVRLGSQIPLFDLQSFGREISPRRDVLSPAAVAQIVRTVSRAPEVLVKVSGGATSAQGVAAHLRYIDRQGKLAIETDEGRRPTGKGAEAELTADWDLEALKAQARGPYRRRAGRTPAKLVHNVILSMPKGTSPEKLLSAGRDFAREQFALRHRYALVLHTDQDHPHVHLVVKAVSEQGGRLNIRKATLREWRGAFAQHLRAHGVAANATERAVRGETRSRFKDRIHRAMLRGESRHVRNRIERIARELRNGGLKPSQGKTRLLETRRDVIEGWHAVVDVFLEAGQGALAQKIWGFIGGMRPPLTTDEQLAAKLQERTRVRERERLPERTR